MKKITDNIYVESEFSRCNNSYVVTKDGVVVIDTPMVPANAKKMAEEAAKFGTVRYIINGEPHTDHVAGNCYYGGTVVSHEGTRRMMQEADVAAFKEQLQRLAPGGLPVDNDFHYRLPEITFSDTLTLYLGDHTFRLIHLPGHTPYNIAVYVPEERAVFTSDNVNLGMPIFFNAVPDKWLDSLKRLEELDVDIVVPGHGEVCGKEAFSQMSIKLKDWVNAVSDAISRGLNVKETIAAIKRDKRFADLPQQGPDPEFLNTNVRRLYEIFKN
ncbi:MAG TPA: MBL fold metallo-hydrolase [Dehalococcoidia bacterium]|nr:MBL fold metallo-hydrolase [Dehalococcoidia bacterium]